MKTVVSERRSTRRAGIAAKLKGGRRRQNVSVELRATLDRRLRYFLPTYHAYTLEFTSRRF